MPNNREFVDTVASLLSENPPGEILFTNLDFKNAYIQLSVDEFTGK